MHCQLRSIGVTCIGCGEQGLKTLLWLGEAGVLRADVNRSYPCM